MDHVLVKNFEDGVTLITINRPEKRNAMAGQTALELEEAFITFEKSDQRVAVLTGAGNEAFSAGIDLTGLPSIPETWRCTPGVGFKSEKPIIAAVAGWCMGGSVVLTMMCDLMVVAENAKFRYPEASRAAMGGMIAGLAGRIPHKVAMEVMMLGKVMTAQRAYEVGFANQVVPVGKQVDAALEMARELAGYGPLALATIKRFVTQSVLPQGPVEKAFIAIRDVEVVKKSADRKEGQAAAREKRKPRYVGR